MQTAKLFENGRSQAVRLPKECRFKGKEVFVRKYEDMVILFPTKSPWSSLVDSLDKFTDDFMEDRNQPDTPGNNFHYRPLLLGRRAGLTYDLWLVPTALAIKHPYHSEHRQQQQRHDGNRLEGFHRGVTYHLFHRLG